MEPVTIALVGVIVFGTVTALSVFIRQLLLSRDKRLNDKAQRKALKQETRELEKLRKEMLRNRRFDSHYQVLGANKDAIQYLDQKIEDILSKKMALVERYSETALKESSAIIEGEASEERKALCDRLREEIDQEIEFYNQELEQLQTRRASIWDSHAELQNYLLDQETLRNQQLDELYFRHTAVLEKIYIRHNKNAERVARDTIEAGTESLHVLKDTLKHLSKVFRLSTKVKPHQIQAESKSRREVQSVERAINEEANEAYHDALEAGADLTTT